MNNTYAVYGVHYFMSTAKHRPFPLLGHMTYIYGCWLLDNTNVASIRII